ncbi:MAG: hypothetical protein AB7U45_10660 [Desulfamplus sp.]
MENNNEEISTITLKTYVDLLSLAAKGKLDNVHKLNGLKRRAARELLNEGFISESESSAPGMMTRFVDTVIITPSGSVAFESLSSMLKEKSNLHKIGEHLLRFLWIIVGALVASLSGVIKDIL